MSITARSLINSGGVGARGGEQVQTPEAVVISPTRELAVQIKDESRKFSAGSGIRDAIQCCYREIHFIDEIFHNIYEGAQV